MATISENLKTIKDSTMAIKQAILDKGGEVGDLTTYADAIRGIQTGTSSSFWTGHVDVEGLKAIGWDDEDIAYFQEHGVNWMEEDDEYHKVSEENKALYGVLTEDNYKEYKDIIVYMPKVDFNISSYNGFESFTKMVGLPVIKSLVNSQGLYYTFNQCYNLTCVPPFNRSITRMNSSFRNCSSIQYIPPMDTSNVTDFNACCRGCFKLEYIDFNMDKGQIIASSFADCVSLKKVNLVLDLKNATQELSPTGCNSLIFLKIKNLNRNLKLSSSSTIDKGGILYIINNEAATSAITITLSSAAYARLANDPDIVAALSNHPNVSLASA